MTSKPTESATGTPYRRKWAILRLLLQRLIGYFEMPDIGRPTLPQRLLAKTGLRWPIASVAVGLVEYAIFLLIGLFDGTLIAINQRAQWWFTLLYPALIIYLLLVQPLLRHMLHTVINTLRPRLPDTERFERLIEQTYTLDPRYEWGAMILAILGGWFLIRPWERESLDLIVHDILGGGVAFGLTGWHLYNGLTRTKFLARLYDQAQNLNLFKQGPPLGPLIRWTLGDITALLIAIMLSAIFIGLGNVDRGTMIIYGIIVSAALLILSFSRMPTSLFSRAGVFRALFMYIFVAVIGTTGFAYFEDWELFDAVYATVITMTTVGYGDISPVTFGGRLFTIMLSLVAIGIAGYAASTLAAFIVEGNLGQLFQSRKGNRHLDKLSNHIILCGAGRIGQQIAIELHKVQIPFVIIEEDEDVIENLLQEVDIPYIHGNAMMDHTLELAGLGRARGLLAALKDDKDNAFVILSAREVAKKLNNPDLYIISRLDDDKQKRKLMNAGADLTISPHATGGSRMMNVMLHPQFVNFLDEMLLAEQRTGQVLRLEEVHINDIRDLALIECINQNELRVGDVGRHADLLVVVIKRASLDRAAPYIYTPRGDTRIYRDDVLIVLGTPEERAKLFRENYASLAEDWLATLEERLSR